MPEYTCLPLSLTFARLVSKIAVKLCKRQFVQNIQLYENWMNGVIQANSSHNRLQDIRSSYEPKLPNCTFFTALH